MRGRRLPIWSMEEGQLRSIVDESATKTEVIEKCGMSPTGAAWDALNRRCAEFGIDLSDLEQRSKSKMVSTLVSGIGSGKPIDELLSARNGRSRGNLKRRLIQEGLLEERCSECGIGNTWNGHPLVLVLDHINGDPNDNRLENLRLLCPNCNSQTGTFCRPHKSKKMGGSCVRCGRPITRHSSSKLCASCVKRKVQDPPGVDELKALLESMSWSAIGRKFGVSDVAVRKWAKKYGII